MTPLARLTGRGGNPRALAHAAQVAARDVLGVRAGERAVVVATPDLERRTVGTAFHDALLAAGADALLLVTGPPAAAGVADPVVLKALETDPDIVAAFTAGPIGSDPERLSRPLHGRYEHVLDYLVGESRSRAVWAPGITRAAFGRLVPVDYGALTRHATGLRAVLADASELRVTSPAGTDLVVPVDGAKASFEDGDYRRPGRGGNLPAGEALVPATAGASGRLVFDATLSLPDGAVYLREPITLEIEDSMVRRVTGGGAVAARIRAALDAGPGLADRAVAAGRLTRTEASAWAVAGEKLAAVGFGLNPAAKVGGVPLIDEKARGSAHIVLGALPGERPPSAPFTVKGVLRRPRVVAVLGDGAEVDLVANGDAPLPPGALALPAARLAA